MQATLPVTVVVPVFNARSRLPALLDALLALNPGPEQFVLVDDGSRDDTYARLRRACANDSRFLVLTQENGGPAMARNRGIQSAERNWVAFTDDDCLPSSGWLGELWTKVQSDPQLVACFGQILARGQKSYLSHYVENFGSGHQTANALYLREVLVRVGGFDERYRTPYLEDTDLFLSAQQFGCIGFAEAALVEHPVRPTSVASKVRRMSYYASDFLLFAKHPEQYRNRHRGCGPLYYLAYYVGFKHGLAILWDSIALLPTRPITFFRVLLALLGERIYLFYLLLRWLIDRPYREAGRNFAPA